MAPSTVFIASSALLPDRAGLLFIYAAMGCLGGVAAAAHRSNDHAPSLWAVFQRAIVGLGTGTAAGCLGLAKLGVDDASFYWTMFMSLVGGFVGPVWAWQLYRRMSKDPTDPTQPSKPTGDPP